MTTPSTEHGETILVTGMTCNHCVQSVTTALAKLGGITNVHVDLPTGRVSYDNAGGVTRERITATIRQAGFQLR